MLNPLQGSAAAFALAATLVLPLHAAAQERGAELDRGAPPAPVAPDVISVDPSGDATVRAVRLTERPRIDGELDEAWYADTPPITQFLQSVPDEGAEPTEFTEAWIGFDEANIYVSARIHDSAPESEWVANEMRRDTNQLRQNDTFGVAFDTFYDRRNAVMFYTNPLGAVADFAMTNEGNPNSDWNPIWNVRTGRFDGGWTVEMEIPFKSLRYRPGNEQVWGIQLRRAIRRKNEWVHLTLVPREAAGTGAMGAFRVSSYGTLVGLETPPPSRNLEIKPYAISGVRSTRLEGAGLEDDTYADAGLDVKYGITENLTLDLTYNTDFAQVEVDEQQVNLTRFNLFFPEKREFFLEGRGIFDFATSPVGAGGGGPGGGGGNAPTLFFSRRIGIHGGDVVPILGGARLTGKVGAFDVGALSVQTEGVSELGVESTNFGVLRLRRDILSRSNVGFLFANRSEALAGEGSNQTYGIDGSFAFFDNLNFLGYWARTDTPLFDERESSYRGRASYDGDLYGIRLEHLLVDDNFNPEVGFLRRRGFRESIASARYSPRPASIESVRQLSFQGTLDYLTDASEGFVEARENRLQAQAEMENSDVVSVGFNDLYERLVVPFAIAPGVVIPTGGYAFRDVEATVSLGLQREISGNFSARYGSFYDGTRTSLEFGRGRVEILPELSVEPSISFNWVDLPQGDFTAHLATARINYSFNPRMFLSGLLQYNHSGDRFASNVRFRWEYAPGSELFVVYTDDRDLDVFDRFSELSNRALVIKVNRLIRP